MVGRPVDEPVTIERTFPGVYVEEIPTGSRPIQGASTTTPARVLAFNQGRDPERLRLKYKAMATSAFSFFRGTCHLYWEDWRGDGVTVAAPLAWACGELHFENFGAFKGGNRLEYFEINDFDKAALAPCTRDPVRFLCSLLLAADEAGLPAADGRRLCQRFLDGFVAALRDGRIGWIERDVATGVVGSLLQQVHGRKRAQLLAKRTVLRKKGRRIRIDGVHALAASDEERATATRLVRIATAPGEERLLRVLHVARRIAGTGSLGVERYTVLVEGKGSPDRNYLLDVKAAERSAMRLSITRRQPTFPSEAERIVWAQRHLQAASPALLRSIADGHRSYVLRELQPREDRLDLSGTRHAFAAFEDAVHTMGRLLAGAQLRASGRRGAASADALTAFVHDGTWRSVLTDHAVTYARRVRQDFRAFKDARKAGFFDDQCAKRFTQGRSRFPDDEVAPPHRVCPASHKGAASRRARLVQIRPSSQ